MRRALLLMMILAPALALSQGIPQTYNAELLDPGMQYHVYSAVGNRPELRFNCTTNGEPYSLVGHTVTWRFAPSMDSEAMSTVTGYVSGAQARFPIPSNTFSTVLSDWYSVLQVATNTLTVSYARGYLTVQKGPESGVGNTNWVAGVTIINGDDYTFSGSFTAWPFPTDTDWQTSNALLQAGIDTNSLVKLDLAGGTMTGDINMGGNALTNASYMQATGHVYASEFRMATETVTATQVSQWDTAYGWGDHGAIGYVTTLLGWSAQAMNSDVVPNASNAYSLGTAVSPLANGRFASTVFAGAASVTGNVIVAGKLAVGTSAVPAAAQAVVDGNLSVYGQVTNCTGLFLNGTRGTNIATVGTAAVSNGMILASGKYVDERIASMGYTYTDSAVGALGLQDVVQVDSGCTNRITLNVNYVTSKDILVVSNVPADEYVVKVKNHLSNSVVNVGTDVSGGAAVDLTDEDGNVVYYLHGTEASYINTGQNFGIGTGSPQETFHVQGTTRFDGDHTQNGNMTVTNKAQVSFLTFVDRSSDPADPANGTAVFWMADGAGFGDGGDICYKIQSGGVVKTNTLIDFSAL